jgi:hypothetical protein
MVAIMNMMIRTQKCPTSWKEGKVVMLPKPCREVGKNLPGNWIPITLTNIMYRIKFGRIRIIFKQFIKENRRKKMELYTGSKKCLLEI